MTNRRLGRPLGLFLYIKADMSLAGIFLQDILIILTTNSKRLFAINDLIFLILLKKVRTFLFENLVIYHITPFYTQNSSQASHMKNF